MKNFVIIFICVLIVGCENRKHSDGIIEYEEDKSVKDWKCYEDKEEGRLCVPPTWEIRTNRKTPFVFDLENENENSFFVLIRNQVALTKKDLIRMREFMVPGYLANINSAKDSLLVPRLK